MNDKKRDYSGLLDDAGAFRQQVRMAAVQVAGLSADDLAKALAYEVEPFSGIPAAEAEVLFKPVDDADPAVRVFDVSVKRRRRRKGKGGDFERWLKPAIGFALAVTALVVVDCTRLAIRRASLRETVAERRPLQAELDRLQANAVKARNEAQAVKSAREAAIAAQDRAAEMRAAHLVLMNDIGKVFGEQAVVTAITGGEMPNSVVVKAVASSTEAAATVMRTLAAGGKASGWRLEPGTISASKSGTTAVFQFTMARGAR